MDHGKAILPPSLDSSDKLQSSRKEKAKQKVPDFLVPTVFQAMNHTFLYNIQASMSTIWKLSLPLKNMTPWKGGLVIFPITLPPKKKMWENITRVAGARDHKKCTRVILLNFFCYWVSNSFFFWNKQATAAIGYGHHELPHVCHHPKGCQNIHFSKVGLPSVQTAQGWEKWSNGNFCHIFWAEKVQA
jgi:hypothetical protein